jgi:hypothetical protein
VLPISINFQDQSRNLWLKYLKGFYSIRYLRAQAGSLDHILQARIKKEMILKSGETLLIFAIEFLIKGKRFDYSIKTCVTK